jgi:hypothetical protein
MATKRQPHLVQTWVKVTDAQGRARMEARWVLVQEATSKQSVAA